MKVYVITECRFDKDGFMTLPPYVRLVSRSREKAVGWYKATLESQKMFGKLLDVFDMPGWADGGFCFSSNYGGLYEETFVTISETETT